ncbi:MAG TPA: hypothetical protein VG673_00395, partial [Actinomycetota bacterium]|nr:hypothetical protein [Actinomycetota bacterium]
SLAVTADGHAVLVGSEGLHSEVWQVPLPAPVLARIAPAPRRPPASAPARATEPAAETGSGWGRGPLLAVTAALALLAVAAAAVVRRRRP